MSDTPSFPPPAAQPAPVAAARAGAADLVDGQWHRVHPLTPLLKGGLFLIVIGGIVIGNLRDRLIDLVLPSNVRELERDAQRGDPIDWILENNLVLLALAAVALVLIVLIAGFYLSWRFHTFRITNAEVEVRKGILQRKHTKAPLDRVQGVNLTRPFVARLIGLAKLEVVGAGTDANVQLEYLTSANADRVRAEILRLASGARARREAMAHGLAADAARSSVERLTQTVSDGITGIVLGAEAPVAEPASAVNIPITRMLLAHLASPATLFLLLYLAAVIITASVGSWWVLFGSIPALLGFGAYYVNSVFKTLRYSIAPTPDGIRVTFGLTTTITEIIPPGRIHALEISQSIFWRPMGWWRIRINRISGRSAQQQQQADPFALLLPVGTREEATRVLALVFPEMSVSEVNYLFEHGLLGPQTNDPFVNTPKRALLFRLLSWRRNGLLVTPDFLLIRRGVVWRQLAIFPLSREQGLTITQGPLDRALNIANFQVNTVAGAVSGTVGILDRDALTHAYLSASQHAIDASRRDRTHRWADVEQALPAVYGTTGDVPEARPVAQPASSAPSRLPGTFVAPVIPVGGIAHPETVVVGEPGVPGVVLDGAAGAAGVAGATPDVPRSPDALVPAPVDGPDVPLEVPVRDPEDDEGADTVPRELLDRPDVPDLRS